jgi:hypothetical protein
VIETRIATVRSTGNAAHSVNRHSLGSIAPFVRGHDLRRKPGPGRPKKAYLQPMRDLAAGGKGEDGQDTPSAEDVIRHHLRKKNLQAAQDLLNRAYGKPKETVQVERDSPIVVITTPDGKA